MAKVTIEYQKIEDTIRLEVDWDGVFPTEHNSHALIFGLSELIRNSYPSRWQDLPEEQYKTAEFLEILLFAVSYCYVSSDLAPDHLEDKSTVEILRYLITSLKKAGYLIDKE